jgi:nucleotidyltransferase/DNA polymerase involved in DNA repair
MEILRDNTGLVEQISIDEAFLDISDIQDDPERFARGLHNNYRYIDLQGGERPWLL